MITDVAADGKSPGHSAESDDWVKALSIAALSSHAVPAGYSGSAVIAAFILVGLTIYSRTVLTLVHLGVTGVLIWLAAVTGRQDPEFALLVQAAVLYGVLSVLLVAETERRRLGQGQFLSAAWWAGQAAIHGLAFWHADAGKTSGFFTDLFLAISVGMFAFMIVQGVRYRRPRAD